MLATIALCSFAFVAHGASASDKIDPAADAKAFRDYFVKKFPKVKLDDFVNGPYSMNADMRKQWKAIEQFPPYDFALDDGKAMLSKPFKNGKSYA
ncbi:MAG: sulfur oxidation c-type cytochrome SoxA, partial [Bradyrhizobium sp.]